MLKDECVIGIDAINTLRTVNHRSNESKSTSNDNQHEWRFPGDWPVTLTINNSKEGFRITQQPKTKDINKQEEGFRITQQPKAKDWMMNTDRCQRLNTEMMNTEKMLIRFIILKEEMCW